MANEKCSTTFKEIVIHNSKDIEREKNMKRKLVSLVLATTMIAALAGCGSESDTAGGSEKKTLVMATNAEFPPYEYKEGDKIVGIDAEIAQAIADELGMKLEIEDIAFKSIIPEVVSGKADMGVAGMTVTDERKENVAFSDPYATSAQVIIVKNDSDIATPEALEGKTIGVQLGTTGDIYSADIKGAKIERYNKGVDAILALTQGKVDAVIIDRQPAMVFVEKNEGIKIVDKEFTVEDYAIAIGKDNKDLLDKVNKALAKLKESGKLQEIIDKYIK